jgi:hypothetical protein
MLVNIQRGERKKNMAKKPGNSGKSWTPAANRQLAVLARGNTPTRVIAMKMERTPAAVESQAARLRLSLKPTNQSPYNRRGAEMR